MQAPEDNEGGTGGEEGDPGAQGGHRGPEVTGGDEGGGGEGAAAQGPPQNQATVQDPVPGGDASAAAAAGAAGGLPLEFRLTVPFRSAMDAEVAWMHLAPVVESLGDGVQSELTMINSEMHISLIAENSRLMESSISSVLSQVSMVFLLLEDLLH